MPDQHQPTPAAALLSDEGVRIFKFHADYECGVCYENSPLDTLCETGVWIKNATAALARATEEASRLRSLAECTVFSLNWLLGKDFPPEFFKCDCSEDGGYMEWDTYAYIHTETCSSGFEQSLEALRDQTKQALFAPTTQEADHDGL